MGRLLCFLVQWRTHRTGARSLSALGLADLFFDQAGDPVGKAASVRLGALFRLLFQLGVYAEVDDFLFCHCVRVEQSIYLVYTMCVGSLAEGSIMQYEAARTELQSPPQRVPLSGMAIEALTLVLIAAAMLWFV